MASVQQTRTTFIEYGYGYDYQFLADKHVLEEYTCLVCKFVARNPQQLHCCGQTVCRICLDTWKENCRHREAATCPHCKQALMHFDDKKCYQKIISLRVHCINTRHGCEWTGELRVLEKEHIRACTHQVIPCPSCQELVPKETLKIHTLNECKKRQVKCPHCPCSDTYEFVYTIHKPQCRLWPVQCPSGCGHEILRGKIEEHRETCKQQIVKCRYFENGCQVVVPRAELLAHEGECSKKKDVLTNGELHINKQKEKSAVAPLMVAFQGFAKYLNESQSEMWESQPIYTTEGGFRICLRVHAQGRLSGSGSHLSCYIHLAPGHFDEQQVWPFKGIVTVTLKNQLEDSNHFEKQFKFLTCHCRDDFNSKPSRDSVNVFGIGDPQFITNKDLEGDIERGIQYLKDDCLIFKIEYSSLIKQQPYHCYDMTSSTPFPY